MIYGLVVAMVILTSLASILSLAALYAADRIAEEADKSVKLAMKLLSEKEINVQADPGSSITDRYNVELIEDDKEHNTQKVKLTPKGENK